MMAKPTSLNMRISNTSVMIVSSVKHSIGYENTLRRNNFTNIRTIVDPVSALQNMEHDHPYIIITDMTMDEMDGFELASNVREIERTENRFSYIILITDEAVHNKVDSAWQSKVDAILAKDHVPFRLVPQMMSAERLSQQTNNLLIDNSMLRNRCESIEEGQLIDPQTGLGNHRQALMRIEDTIKQIETRGGVIAILLVQIGDLLLIKSEHNENIVDEMIVAVGSKLRRLVRPLDMVAHFGSGLFAVVMQHDSLEDCQSKSYERIGQNLGLKSYQTRAGYLQAKILVGVCGTGAETGPPKVDYLISTAQKNLTQVTSTSSVNVTVLNPFESNAEAGGI